MKQTLEGYKKLAKLLVTGFKEANISQGSAKIILDHIVSADFVTGLGAAFESLVIDECWRQNLWTPTIPKKGEKAGM